jgi:thymidylate synthase
MEIKEKTTMDAWKSGMKAVLDEGREFIDTNKRVCREVINLKIDVSDPKKDIARPIETLNEFKKWVYPPIDEIENIILSKKLAPAYAYSYGPAIFNYDGRINQIDDFVIPLLKSDPVSRRATVILWDPRTDSNPNKKAAPGFVMLHFRIEEGRLNSTAVIRSNDMFFGWPANIYQMFVIQEYIAKKLNCKTGSLTTFSISAHIFKDEFDEIKQVLEKK